MALVKRARRSRPVAEIEKQLRAELDALRPLLGVNECAISLSRFDEGDGTAILEIVANCPDCDVSAETFLPGIETRLKLQVSELRQVRVIPAGLK